MGIKLLVIKNQDDNQYRHYLQEYKGNEIFITDSNLCEDHTSYIVEIVNTSGEIVDCITFTTGTTNLVFGRAGRLQ